MEPQIHIVFDGPPGPESGRFVEVETPSGRSIRAGIWKKRRDGYWVLILTPEDFPFETTCSHCDEPMPTDAEPDGCRDPNCPMHGT